MVCAILHKVNTRALVHDGYKHIWSKTENIALAHTAMLLEFVDPDTLKDS